MFEATARSRCCARSYSEAVGDLRYYVLGDWLFVQHARGLEVLLMRPKWEGVIERKHCSSATENVFKVEGDTARLEGVHADKTCLKVLAILGGRNRIRTQHRVLLPSGTPCSAAARHPHDPLWVSQLAANSLEFFQEVLEHIGAFRGPSEAMASPPVRCASRSHRNTSTRR